MKEQADKIVTFVFFQNKKMEKLENLYKNNAGYDLVYEENKDLVK